MCVVNALLLARIRMSVDKFMLDAYIDMIRCNNLFKVALLSQRVNKSAVLMIRWLDHEAVLSQTPTPSSRQLFPYQCLCVCMHICITTSLHLLENHPLVWLTVHYIDLIKLPTQLIHWTNTSTHTIKLTLNYPTTTCANTDKHSTLSLSQSPHSLNTHTPSHSFTHTKVMYKHTHIHTQWNSPTNKITCLQHTHTPIHNHPHTLIHTLTNPQPLTHIFTLHCSSINAVVDNWILRQFTYELVQYRV